MLTGRMHLAILGFTRGTPTITIAYQGKVAGLYERMGLSEYVIEPGETIAHDLRAALLRAENDLERCRDLIAAAMPGLRDDGGANSETQWYWPPAVAAIDDISARLA